jgi:hypothetical protein
MLSIGRKVNFRLNISSDGACSNYKRFYSVRNLINIGRL